MGKVVGLLAICAIAFSVVAIAFSRENTSNDWDSCNAPCIVHFPGHDMHEDEFGLNYNGNGTVEVWFEQQ